MYKIIGNNKKKSPIFMWSFRKTYANGQQKRQPVPQWGYGGLPLISVIDDVPL